jgi:1-acyl-sn-glycerol-3-phosphate acyltransferase
VVEGLVRELHPRGGRPEVVPGSRIERDLGIDSLGRTELVLRIEQAFRVRLPARTVGEAETVEDLLVALDAAGPAPAEAAPVETVRTARPSGSPPGAARTLIDVLEWHAARHPDRIHLTVLQDEATPLGSLTCSALLQRAQAVGRGLVARDVMPGDRVALMLPTGVDFFAAWFGILYAGGVPVPIYPPLRPAQIEDHLRRQRGILENAGAVLLLTVPEGRRLAALLRGLVGSLRAVASVEEIAADARDLALPPPPAADRMALIQYTSGSTGDPKGVVLTHANLLANIRAMGAVMEADSRDVFVSWLPLYHDMGLIGAWLGSLYYGAELYVMSPLSFLVRPQSWLRAIHRYRATLSAAPNFAFELCLAKVSDEDLEGLDLSSLRMLANGAEPVSAQALRHFTERFGPYGLSAAAMTPVYGLAEGSLGLSFPPPGRGPVVDRIDRERLTRDGVAEPAPPDAPNALELVGCGYPLPGHEVRIVDAGGRELPERHEGRLEFRGPSATSGYFNNPGATGALIRDGWLASGDLAYTAGGEVFITGRTKDIIIRAGRHLHPQEVEEAIAAVPGIRKGGIAVFGVTDRRSGTERVVVLAETRETGPAARSALEARVRDVVLDTAGTPPDEIVLAPPRSVPKTSSGKIRRSTAKQLYERGRLGRRERRLWWQVVRLAAAGLWPRAVRLFRRLRELAYAVWWWGVIAGAVALALLAVVLLPRRAWRWRALRGLGRGAFALVGAPVRVRDLDRIPPSGAVLVFNHSSYLDACVLAAALPGEPALVAKRDLPIPAVLVPLLRRLGTPFVERYDVAGSVTDAGALVAVAREGRPVVIFPEGTFTRRVGLAGFYLGAFKVAAEAGVPVLPGVIRGTRTMLRGDQWFPRHAPLAVELGAAIPPAGTDFASLVRVRDAAREVILAGCGEPDLGELSKPEPGPASG